MATPTSMIKPECILNMVIANEDKNDVPHILPFFRLKVYDETGKAKILFCNYTFGQLAEDEENIEFDSDLGKMKFNAMGSIESDKFDMPNDVAVIFLGMPSSIEKKKVKIIPKYAMIEKIVGVINAVPEYTRLLFIWPKRHHDDEPFYTAININKNSSKTEDTALPILMADAGLKCKKDSPFSTVDIDPDTGFDLSKAILINPNDPKNKHKDWSDIIQ